MMPFGVHSIDPLPTGEEGMAVAAMLTADFGTRFEAGLSQTDRELFSNHGLDPPDKLAGARIVNNFDKFIQAQASVLGGYLFHIEPVRRRILQWHLEPDGPELMRRLGEALALGIRVSRSEGHLPIDDPRWHTFKRETVVELRALQKRIARGPRHLQSREEILERIEQEISSSIAEFQNLAQNLGPFLAFLQQPEQSRTAKLFMLKQLRPAALFDQWAGWSTNRDPEKLRQLISSQNRERRPAPPAVSVKLNRPR